MKLFLKYSAGILAVVLACGFASCKNDKEIQEEANASTVNIEKGVASPVWTPEGESAQKPATDQETRIETQPQVEEMAPEVDAPEVELAPVEEKTPEPKPAPAPAPKETSQEED